MSDNYFAPAIVFIILSLIFVKYFLIEFLSKFLLPIPPFILAIFIESVILVMIFFYAILNKKIKVTINKSTNKVTFYEGRLFMKETQKIDLDNITELTLETWLRYYPNSDTNRYVYRLNFLCSDKKNFSIDFGIQNGLLLNQVRRDREFHKNKLDEAQTIATFLNVKLSFKAS